MERKKQQLTLFYDGHCPLCLAEIKFLGRRNHANLLRFVDIHSEVFDSNTTAINCEQALAKMYGQYQDGTYIEGVEVFAQAYERAGLNVLAWIFSRQLIRPLLNQCYGIFARHRHFISRCFGRIALKLVAITEKKTR